MYTFTRALVLIAGLTLGLVGRPVLAAPTSSDIRTLGTQTISSSDFNSMFKPYNTAILSPFRFDGSATDSGLIQSQVFQGSGKMAGLYGYAYQVGVNPASDTHVDSMSLKFGSGLSTPKSAGDAYGFLIPNGQVGGLNLSGTQSPSTLSWQPGQSTGFLRAQFVDPAQKSGALDAGTNSATFVVLSTEIPSTVKPSVNVGGASATTTIPVAYTVETGTPQPVPVPEPATILSWVGVVGVMGLVRRYRTNRTVNA